jgi:DnaJ-class molecular chaperone
MREINWRDLSSSQQKSTSTCGWTEIEPQKNFYEMLEVSCNASPEVIRAAYRALMEKHHPDKHSEHLRASAEEMARDLNHAYAVLSDPQKRREYDRAHRIYRKA